ncbi:hypothetical protein BDQ12DRAFT_720326 [Crucibulum laeve]|uniref:Uncharacterized protein n=1 Tax=Crucibulum laeve TaxID=68775 RepID=A0A5C3M7N8_9AGAR|nr:hypothetical protein BDQ12DRAFT_720326 [Crucibulum laeve]
MSRSHEKKNEKVDWMKVAEETVLHDLVYHAITSTRSATINELSTFAMDAARSYAKHAKPGSHSKTKVSEKLVLAELDVAGAIDRLAASSVDIKGDDGCMYSPLEVLGCSLVLEHVKEHLGGLFIETVNPTREDGEKNNDDEICRTIDAAKELGGTISELGRVLERVWRTPSSVTSEDLCLKGYDEEVRALLTALVLYKRVFAAPPEESALLTPHPSLKGKEEEGGMMFELRRALGN